jgi:hypothetical protein
MLNVGVTPCCFLPIVRRKQDAEYNARIPGIPGILGIPGIPEIPGILGIPRILGILGIPGIPPDLLTEILN